MATEHRIYNKDIQHEHIPSTPFPPATLSLSLSLSSDDNDDDDDDGHKFGSEVLGTTVISLLQTNANAVVTLLERDEIARNIHMHSLAYDMSNTTCIQYDS